MGVRLGARQAFAVRSRFGGHPRLLNAGPTPGSAAASWSLNVPLPKVQSVTARVAGPSEAQLRQAALITPRALSEELGGLGPAASHAAELAADALHRALGMAARDGAAS